ncbi:phosphoglycolate phosphatase [Aliiroseovarius sediminilitoris]|uniref:phosphoglycolate phosphatase n=1 Tax=Aliiroseovarius sediminilitoris TaxID=1173584 RepID=A0A1I0P9D6_9RHOB|nr:HAD family hydrolase [Aliiroseovarius sediminilitoris]SEW10913.1 phosphoglycolate phosphatase [Aliiroseovarius sediminilitoris]
MSVDALLFDKDGTLFLFEATWESWAHAVLMRLTDGDLDRARMIGDDIGFDVDSKRFQPTSVIIACTPTEIVSQLRRHVAYSAEALETLLNEEAAVVPQVEAVSLAPFLTQLRQRGLKIGVATNDAEYPARAHLDAAGVTGLFDFISGYDSGHGAKPAPGPCLAFATATGVAPDRVAMVGDSLHDLHAGRAAGMKTIAVLTGIAQADELAPFADIVLDDISHIPAWLDSEEG